MDLSTKYLGLTLKNPIVPSACAPLSSTVDRVKELEDAGASAVVVYSLFEEQIIHEINTLDHYLNFWTDSYAEALTYFPEPKSFLTSTEEYLEHLRTLKKSVAIPIIASLNGNTEGGWIEYARHIEKAGADALELNIYHLPTDPLKSSVDVEEIYLNIVRTVKSSIKIPVAVKIGPYFSSLASMIRQLDLAGADAIVLFNRFYQPDLDLEQLEVVPHLVLSTAFEMRLPLRWVAIMYGKVRASLAVTSGVHTFEDVLKVMMAGGDVAMMCSELLKNGVGRIQTILEEMKTWMEEHDYHSLAQMKGSMSQMNVPDATAFERANYMKTLYSYRILS